MLWVVLFIGIIIGVLLSAIFSSFCYNNEMAKILIVVDAICIVGFGFLCWLAYIFT